MAKLNVYNMKNEVVDSINLNDMVFDVEYNEPLIHQVIVALHNNARQGTKSTLTRSEVNASKKKMYRQKGRNGVIVRHLILPSQINNSKKALWNISDISFNINVSLMSQYTPCEQYKQEYLNQYLNEKEYQEVCDYFYEIGLSQGLFQELSSQNNLVPDALKDWKIIKINIKAFFLVIN